MTKYKIEIRDCFGVVAGIIYIESGNVMLADKVAQAMFENTGLLVGFPEEVKDELPKVKQPCGECHLKPGEVCDICGAIDQRRQIDYGPNEV